MPCRGVVLQFDRALLRRRVRIAGSMANRVFSPGMTGVIDLESCAAQCLPRDWGSWSEPAGRRGPAAPGIVVVQEILLVFAAIRCAVASRQRGWARAVIGKEPLRTSANAALAAFSVPRISRAPARGWNVSMNAMERPRLCASHAEGV